VEANAPNTILWLRTCLDYESHQIQLYTTYHNAMFTACSKCTDHNKHVDTRSALTLVYSNIVARRDTKPPAAETVRVSAWHRCWFARNHCTEVAIVGPENPTLELNMDSVGFGLGPDWTRSGSDWVRTGPGAELLRCIPCKSRDRTGSQTGKDEVGSHLGPENS